MEKLQLSHIGRSVKIPSKLRTFEPTHASRYLILANMLASLGTPQDMKILDVGGKKGLLRLFPGFTPTVIDIEDSDEPDFVKGSALDMPFKDGAFDYAVSCDVLEHIPAADRERFLTEMLRVSRKGVILCAPFNSPLNEVLEPEMNDYYYHLSGEHHRWLREHIDNGLPSEEAVESQLKRQKIKYVKFRHFSPANWRTIVKYHLLHTTFGDNEILEKSVYAMYGQYYDTMCNLDFAEDGYRTFFWISKTGEPQAIMPEEADIAKATETFQQGVEDTKLGLLEQEMTSLRDLRQAEASKNEQVVAATNKAEALQRRLQAVNDELDQIKASKAWRAVVKARTAKAKLKAAVRGQDAA